MTTRVSYLLDTKILSETRRKQADAQVVAFLAATEPSALFISVLSLGELRKGVALKSKSDPETASLLASWVDGLEYSFADRILGVDAPTARLWGEWSGQRPRPIIDALLAATAAVHSLTLATRNTADVRDLPVPLFDPFEPRPSSTQA